MVEAKAFGDLVGQSAALRQVVSQIDLVAATEASVLILGETGTGKDLVAHEIHRRSPRKDNPLVRVNCASIPKELFESEFFGHVKGAFTGAIKDRAGRFETAEGGTLFLDEIGEVPLEMQSKLLRVLQEKRYERVGEDRTRHADVRIIAATNRDLKKEVAAGRFREDLYYRLHVFPIHVTTLKERKDDIPLLAKHFVDLSVKELRCPKPRLTRAAVARLQNYDWPGNVRELRNVIERAVILARGGPLHFDLPVTDSTPLPPSSAPHPGAKAGLEYFTEAEMRRRERENLVAVLESAGWKIKGADGAAELLGVKAHHVAGADEENGIEKARPARVIDCFRAPPLFACGSAALRLLDAHQFGNFSGNSRRLSHERLPHQDRLAPARRTRSTSVRVCRPLSATTNLSGSPAASRSVTARSTTKVSKLRLLMPMRLAPAAKARSSSFSSCVSTSAARPPSVASR